MSETEEKTGSDFTLANAGLERAPTEPVQSSEPETFGPGIEGVREAANRLTRERGDLTEQPLVKRTLEWRTGAKAGQTVDLREERMSLTAEQAAKTNSEAHRAEDEFEANANLDELARGVDRAREWANGQQSPVDAQTQPAQAEAPAPTDAPQAESDQPGTGMDPDFAALLEKKPQLRAQLQQEFGAVEHARQQYEQTLSQLTQFATAGVLAKVQAKYPSISAQQIPAAMALLETQDPQFLAEIRADANRALSLVQASQQVQAQQAQQHQEQFKQWAKSQDKILESKAPELVADPEMKTSRAALKTLRDVGYSEEELASAWNGQPFNMRDARAQMLILKASKYDQAMAGISQSEPKPLPPVHRPGIAPSPGERSSGDMSELRAQFKRASGNEQLRLGAKLMRLQRGG